MSAASSPATTMPRTPVGRTCCTISGNAACAADGTTWPVAGSTSADKPRALAGLGQRQRDHAGDDEDEDRQQLEEGGEDRAAPRLGLVGRAERALHDVLVGAPVPEADDRRAEQHAEPRIVAVEVPGDAAGFLDRRPRALEAGRHERLPQVEHLRPEHGPQLAPAAERVEAVDGQQQRADHEDQGLHRFGVGDRAHPAEHRVDAGQDDDQHRPDPEAVQHDAAEVQATRRAAGCRRRRRRRRCRPRSW